MPVVGLGEVLISPTFTGLQAKVGRTMQGIASKEGASAGKTAGGKFGGAFKLAAGTIAGVFAVDKVMDFFGAAVKGAGEIEQSIGAINSVFGSNSSRMHKWSKNAARDVGLTANEFNELGTLIGAQLKNGGTAMDELAPKTQSLIGLGADLSSMFGGTTKDAVAALSSALKGERDPIEAYGVSLSQAKIDAEAASLGFEKVGNSLSAEATQAATLSLIMKQTTDAHGNFAKEADTFAGAQQRMNAQWGDLTSKIGALFLPVLSGAIGFMSTKALPVIDEIVGGVRAFGAAFKDSGTDVTSSGLAGFIERVGLGLGGIWTLISAGDYSAKLRGAFGWEEDHPFVTFLFGARDALISFGEWVQQNRAWLEPLTVAVVAGAVAYKLYALATSGVGTALSAVTKFIQAAQAAQWGLNAAMAANPIGIIVVAVAALAAGFIYLWNTNEGFRNFFIGAWRAIQGAVAAAAEGIRSAWEGIRGAIVGVWENSLKPVFDGMVGAVQAVGGWFVGLWQNHVAPAWNGIVGAVSAAWAVISGVFNSIVSAIVTFLTPTFLALKSALMPVWIAISGAVQIAWAIIETIFLTMRYVITDILAPAFDHFWNNVIKPVWAGVTAAIQSAWKIMGAVFGVIVAVVRNTLGVAFTWLYEKIIKPIWTGISSFIRTVWNTVVKVVFDAIKWYIENILAPVFKWIYEKIIKPVWDGISKTIKDVWTGVSRTLSDVWENKIKPVFEALGNFITKTVAPAFEKGVKAIKDIFNGVRNAAAAPINFVIGTVYNDGLRKALNKVRSVVGGDQLPELATIPAFARGGQMGRGWKLVGEEGPELINTGPGYVYTANETKRMLAGQSQMPMQALNQANPVQAHDGIGGFFGDAWNAITSGAKKATDWIRGGLANAAGLLLNPIKDGLAALLPDTGLGDIAQRAASSVIDGALDWIRGKDAADLAAGKGSYSGPLGSFFRPAGGFITSGFGASRGAWPHAGIDFAVPVGSMVRAMFDGVVQKAAWNAVTGRSGMGMLLGHGDGMSSYYGHLSGWLKNPGDKVKAGEAIALSGNTGNSTGPHLHAELWKNNQPFNFASYLHDSGGVLNPGLSMILNNSRKPEAILNNQQWADVHKLALSGGNGVTYAPTYQYLGENPEQVAARDRARLMDVLTINNIA